MKKNLFGALTTLVILLGLSAGTVLAADQPDLSPPPGISIAGPYEGVFYGIVHGDNNSRAIMAMQLSHRDGLVEGKVYLGDGLYIDAGVCGNNKIPSMLQYASGMTNPNNPNELAVQTNVNVSGFDIGIDLNSLVSADGETLTAEASIDLPWICGSDPSFNGTLNRLP
jgi:hypothetical protein